MLLMSKYIFYLNVNIFKNYQLCYSYIACQLLLKYLTDTPISPLPKEMVEIPDPYCTEVKKKMFKFHKKY